MSFVDFLEAFFDLGGLPDLDRRVAARVVLNTGHFVDRLLLPPKIQASPDKR